ncbi:MULTISPECIES: non-ribosomal peptide synthetase [Bacillus cereus group]|uniref:Non-ribosomal peptide synthetase n=1 Tax=Bacillus thuringiensis TaxID=1428 RepID=A0A9X7AMR5_BACTU|nr:non-ribosomal peptide synthetase [Bacillus thuringiensis]MCQ6335105.1 amino acid adenylation domain-containing protein [Bacillus cereus]PFT45860.1 non-ribosomal peptide synthetase [Bacillus thuringiensis]
MKQFLKPKSSHMKNDAQSSLTENQKALWLAHQIDEKTGLYHEPVSIQIKGVLDIQQLQKALQYIVNKHVALQMHILDTPKGPKQILQEDVQVEMTCYDWCTYQEEEKVLMLDNALQEALHKAFDFASNALFRFQLFKLKQNEHLLHMVFHHIMFDGWSLGLFLQDLEEAYASNIIDEEELPSTIDVYQNLLHKQQNYIGTDSYVTSETYWHEKLEGTLPWSEFPLSIPKPLKGSYKEGAYQTILNYNLNCAVHDFSKEHYISKYRILLSMYIVLLHKMTNQTDLIVGMPINMRERNSQEQNVFGYFVNTIPLRVKFSTGNTFLELVQKIDVLVQEALEHKQYPVQHMINQLSPTKEQINPKLYPTVFNMVKLPSFHMKGLETKVLTHQKRVSIFDMVWRMMQTEEDQLQLELDYNAAFYTEKDVQTFVERFQHLMQTLIINKNVPLQDVDLLLPQDYALYQKADGNLANSNVSKTLDQLIDEQANKTPSCIAMTMGKHILTYQELQVQSSQVAQALLQKELKKQERVSILMNRSIDAIVAMIGVLKAGGTYVPIDPDFPVDRIHFILQDSESTHVITDQKTNLPYNLSNTSIIMYETLSKQIVTEQLQSKHTPYDEAYIIYTSGSTGTPKGVLISHQSILQFIHSLQGEYNFLEQQVHLQFASFIFDASVWEIYGSLLTGGRLHLLSDIERKSIDHFIAVIHEQKVQYCLLPTVFFHTLTQASGQQLEQIASLQYVFVGGETLLPEMVRNWQSKVGLHIPVVNAYGPTEITVCATTYPITQPLHAKQTHIPIGKPLSHTNIYVLNENGQLCPPYVPGEIYIGGNSLATKYINQPEKTKETFVQVHIPNTSETKMYKSGDQGRLTYDGQIEFLGRIDKQVKIRGYRIELEEIEERLLQHPSIQQAVVTVYKNETSHPLLIAFYKETENKNVNINTRDLKEFLSKNLPYFMIPDATQHVDIFPVTPSGKIDQKSLLAVFNVTLVDQDKTFVSPHTDTEKQLQQIWGDVLQKDTEAISIEEDFFTIGGHSLLTVQLINRIETQLYVKLTFKDLYKYRTIQTCSACIDQLRPIEHNNSVMRVPDQGNYPLSHAQQRLWFLYKKHPEYRTYDIPIQVHIEPGIQAILLKQALEEMMKRHDIFRTRFIEKDGEPMQCIQEEMNLMVAEVDIQHIEKQQQEQYRLTTIQEMDHTAFNLEQGPLLRSILFTEKMECSWLYINFHHIIMDEWSLQRFLQELFVICEELSEHRIIPPTKPAIRYIDYVAWQNKQLAAGIWEQEKGYWKQELQDTPLSLALPFDNVRPSLASHRGDIFSTKLNQTDVSGLKQLAQQEQISLYMLLFSAYIHFLQQISGQQDLVVGTPVTGRQHEAFENVQGFFVNTVAIRVHTAGASTMEALCKKVKEKCLLAFQHQSYPFDRIIKDVNPERGEHVNPIFSTMFSYQQNAIQQHHTYRYQIQPVSTTISKFDLSLACEEIDGEILLHFEYATDLFERETISRFMKQFVHTLQVIQTNFATPFGQLDMLSKTDHVMYQQLNATDLLLPPYHSIQERFYEQVHARPEAVAISTEDKVYTYHEINQRSNQIARGLMNLGVQKGDRVAIFLHRSVESIIAMLGILKAGGTYVPIDVKYPFERIQYILQDSKATVTITKMELQEDLVSYLGHIVSIEDLFNSSMIQDVLNQNIVEDIAYMIYTSGSTGKPKGTLLRHKGVLNLVEWRSRTFQITENDVFSQFYSHSFDSSVSEIFSALLTGARLHLLNEEQRFSTQAYCHAISTYHITISDVATAFFKQLAADLSAAQLQQLQPLRVLSMGGESASAESIRTWQSKLGDKVLLVNEYGPTETTVSSLYYLISQHASSDMINVPIGKPIANTKIYILNEHMQMCPTDVIGELYIESVGTAIGYNNQPERTKQAFVSNPFLKESSAILYRTGDLVRLSPEGYVEYMGRRDRQVKIRGYRIELGEIEDILIKESRIQQAVVLLNKEKQELHAYFTIRDKATIDIEKVYNHASSLLPQYMVPTGYVCVNELLLTPNGKIDVSKLTKQYTVQYRKQKNFSHPITETQIILAKVWEEVLGVQHIGLQDDFFALGGHSLKIMPTLVKLKPHFSTLHIQDFFQYRTIEKLAEKIENDRHKYMTIETNPQKQSHRDDDCIQKPTNYMPLQISKQHPQCVLLTGATGFLGAHILQQLLHLPNTIVYCLVRPQKSVAIEEKVMEKMQFYFGEQIVDQMKNRVYMIEGDLSKKHVALTTDIQEKLENKIDTIIHCGGDVRHYGDREHFRKINVESTRYLLQMSKKARARFHYISTVSISGHRPDDPTEFLFTEQDFDRGQQLENVYVESKFLAEKLVREAMKKGIPATVYRVGNLVGRTQDGKFQQNIEGNAFYRLIKALLLLQTAPDIPIKIDLVPVNFSSEAIVGLACTEQSKGETFHICNPVQLEWQQFIAHLQQSGYSLELIQSAEFMNLFTTDGLSEYQRYALELLVPVLEETEKNSEAIINCQYTQQFIIALDIACEHPNQKWISKLISYGKEIDFFPTKTLPLLIK